MKLKALLFTAALAASGTASAGYMCSYGAYIDEDNRFSSSGARLSSVAQILQQERADFYKFGREGRGDCYFHNSGNRQKISGMLNRGSVTPAAKRRILSSNGYVTVDVYSSHIDVY